MYLAADIGGTKSLVALADNARTLFQRRFANDDYPDLQALLIAFRDAATCELGAVDIARGCLAIAGPVAGPRARLTNRPWTVDADALSEHLGIARISLVNDFAGTAAGLPSLADDDCQILHAGRQDPDAPRLVLGPGTGFGVAACLPDGRIVPSEGSHIAFAPVDAEQIELLRFLSARTGRVNIEAVVSGPGLVACHEFIVNAFGITPIGSPATAAEIAGAALRGDDAHCSAALDLFLRVFGAFAGDMALTFLARGGVYLAGGIVPKILPRLVDGPFLAAFGAKAEHAGLAADMPVLAVLCEDLGLRGALALVRNPERT